MSNNQKQSCDPASNQEIIGKLNVWIRHFGSGTGIRNESTRMRILEDLRKAVVALSPVETTADRPDCTKCLEQEERATAYADQLAAMVGVLVGEDMGEHSSENEPWENAIEALRVAIGRKQSSVEPSLTQSTQCGGCGLNHGACMC